MAIAYDLTTSKKNEIQKLTVLLQRVSKLKKKAQETSHLLMLPFLKNNFFSCSSTFQAEEQNRQKEARISMLKKQTQDLSGTADRIEKVL
jgi:hypothetical protein